MIYISLVFLRFMNGLYLKVKSLYFSTIESYVHLRMKKVILVSFDGGKKV